MAARNETMAARNMPLTSPPKRTRLDIFGTSAEKASALKASSWHAGTQFSLSEEVEELHGRRAFDEDVSMGQCFNSIGSLGANSSRETASGESPLRRKVASKPDSGGVRVYERDSGKFNDGGSGGVFEMDMGEEVESVAASAPTKQFTGSMSGGLCGTGTSSESHHQTAGRRESPGPGGVKGGAQSEGGVFDMDADVSAGTSTQGTSLQTLPATDIWGMAAAEKRPSNAGTVGDESSEARASATSEAEASALAVLHAMAAGIVAPVRTHTHTHGIGASAANWSIGAAVAAAASANAANKDSQQLPVLVKSDGTTMVVSEEFLTKMGIPLVAPVAPLRAGGLPFPQASPATTAASGFMGMSLDTPKGARADAFNSAGAPINTGCDAVLTALGVLSSADMRAATASRSDAGMHSAAVAVLTESIAGSASSREYTGAMFHNESEEGLSVADEAAIAALQELGASAGRWSNEGGRGSRAGESPSSGPGGSSINSRHGAARGRQVTRSCPGCAERISIACKFCTLCGYTFRRSSTQPSQPSTPRDSMLSPSRTADMSVGALVAAAAAAATEIDDGVDGAKTLSALLKRAKGEGASADNVLAAVSVVLTTPGENRSKMTTPIKLEGCSTWGTASPAGHDASFGQPSIVKRESPEGGSAAAGSCGVGEFDRSPGVGTPTTRQTVTRVTANSLELHKIKEQARRAREKQLLARLQSLLFDNRESPPSASEVTYNLVLTCAVESLRERFTRRGHDLSHLNIDEAIAPEPSMTPRDSGSGSHSSAEMEKHKIKEQQRRAKKRQLLSTLQSIVLGEAETNSKATGITGNYILELVVVQLEKERIETAGGAAPAAIAAVKTEFC